jgi:hypothetical protein
MLLLSGMAGSQERGGGPPSQSIAPGLGATLADITKMPDLFTGSWGTMAGFVEDDEKAVPPFTAKAQKYVDSYKHLYDIPYSEDGCRTPGLPLTMRIGGQKFTFSPGLISIYMGTVAHTRFISLNKQIADLGQTTPKYYGNSVGHWEGDTLVVETVNFVPEVTFQYGVGTPLPPAETVGVAPRGGGPPGGGPRAGGPRAGGPPGGDGPPGGGGRGGGGGLRGGAPGEPVGSLTALSGAIWGPHGKDMSMVERMRLVDKDTLVITTAVHDDTVWTKPYESKRTYRRRGGDPSEWVCTVAITAFDPETNSYNDKDPEEMVKFLDKLGR